MTLVGLCHNATFPQSRISVTLAQDLDVDWVRTIVYDPNGIPEHANSWVDTIASAQELEAQGIHTLVVFNSESFGGDATDIPLMTTRLDAFLNQANGAVAAIEPGNELDTPRFGISNHQIIEIGAAAAEVCARHGVKCLSPSLLRGPEEGGFEAVVKALAGKIDAMAVHPYYCSIAGQPWPGFVFDTIEHKADICGDDRRNPAQVPTWFTECGCPSSSDWLPSLGDDKLNEIRQRIGREPATGPGEQAEFTRALRAFQHPAIEVIFQFALFDAVVPAEEIAIGKTFGLIDGQAQDKISLGRFRPVTA